MEKKRRKNIEKIIKKSKNNKGMSLITLLIIIVIIVSISSTIAYFINKNNVLEDAKKVATISNFATLYEELNLYIQNELSDNQKNFIVNDLNVDSLDKEKIHAILPSIVGSEFDGKVGIREGKLDITNFDDEEKKDYITKIFFVYE